MLGYADVVAMQLNLSARVGVKWLLVGADVVAMQLDLSARVGVN